jgi:hypothetical protein
MTTNPTVLAANAAALAAAATALAAAANALAVAANALPPVTADAQVSYQCRGKKGKKEEHCERH